MTTATISKKKTRRPRRILFILLPILLILVLGFSILFFLSHQNLLFQFRNNLAATFHQRSLPQTVSVSSYTVQLDDLLSDPDKVVDIIVAAQDAIGQVDVSDEEISSAIDVAASGLGISLTDSEKSTLVQLYNKFKNMDLDETELRSQITKVYDKLESLGITKDDVKGIIGKLIDIAKSLLN